MNYLFFITFLLSFDIAFSTTIPKCNSHGSVGSGGSSGGVGSVGNSEDSSRYYDGSCNTGGTYSVNEFGANICEYVGNPCPIVKYFTYPEGGNGVELCCLQNSDCNYAPVKNYCHPDLDRCVDGSYFGCSEKAGPLFPSCL